MVCEAAGRGHPFEDRFSIPRTKTCHESLHIAHNIPRQITRHRARKITLCITHQISPQRTRQTTRNITRHIVRHRGLYITLQITLEITRHVTRQIIVIIISHGCDHLFAKIKAILRLSLQHFYLYFKVRSLLVLYFKGAQQRCFASL